MNSRHQLWLVAIIFAALGLGLSAWLNRHHASQAAPGPDNPANHFFQSEFGDGKSGVEKMTRWQGKPVILNFWASWCPPCIKEMPELSGLAQELKPQGIEVIGIGVDSVEHITEFSRQHPVSYPLYVAGITGTELTRQLGNETGGLPFTVLIGADGKIKKTYLGSLDFKQLRLDIAQVFK